MGMKIISAVIIEWVGPLCSSLIPMRMSASGMMDSSAIRGMLMVVLVSFVVVLLSM